MCGIIGCVGRSEVLGVLIKGLKTLEYRGYDSSGVAVYHPDFRQVLVAKSTGRVSALEQKTADIKGKAGIGHTRWATHGGVCDENAHPHKFGRVTVVHNGIIENFEAIKNQLGVESRLTSQTDSEVVAALIDKYYCTSNAVNAIVNAVRELAGTYALGVMFDDIPDTVFAVRNVSPIVCCQNRDGTYLASDITAIGEYSGKYFVLPEFSVARLTADGVDVRDFSGGTIEPEMRTLDWDIKNSGKCGYPFYMEKEIMQQPEVLKKTIESRIVGGRVDFSADGVQDGIFTFCDNISIIACGTAMHAGLVGKHLLEKYCKIPVSVYMASEYMYNDPIITDKTLMICVSQSGETIDTLEALKYAKKNGAKILSVINVKGSSIARESEYVIYTQAGAEIAVASTKAYTTQVAVFCLICAKTACLRGLMSDEELGQYLSALKKIPSAVAEVLEKKDEIHTLAKDILTAENVFMIGRGADYPALLEASLKLKEISYIHCEAFASGELKHGTIALITQKTPVISLLTQDRLAQKQLSNLKEVLSRGARVLSFVKKSQQTKNVPCDFALPPVADDFAPLVSVVAMQLLAYYVSGDKGLDVDKPRNLAKVVTVE